MCDIFSGSFDSAVDDKGANEPNLVGGWFKAALHPVVYPVVQTLVGTNEMEC